MSNGGATLMVIGIIILIVFVAMTLIGALILWILGHFIDFEFSWGLALAIGFVFSLISGGLSSRRN